MSQCPSPTSVSPGSLPVLITFAVSAEAKPFRQRVTGSDPVQILVTGIGPAKAEQAARRLVSTASFRYALSCGFAGGLNPEHVAGTLLSEADPGFPFTEALRASGATPARFHSSQRVMVTAQEKQALYAATQADAVEMESAIIRKVCQEQGIPSATLRVISDPANEDLPIDFNRLLNSRGQIDPWKLMASLLRRPGRVWTLARLGRQTQLAARTLAAGLLRVVTHSQTSSS